MTISNKITKIAVTVIAAIAPVLKFASAIFIITGIITIHNYAIPSQVIQHPSLVGIILSQLFGIEGHTTGSHSITQLLSGYTH